MSTNFHVQFLWYEKKSKKKILFINISFNLFSPLLWGKAGPRARIFLAELDPVKFFSDPLRGIYYALSMATGGKNEK